MVKNKTYEAVCKERDRFQEDFNYYREKYEEERVLNKEHESKIQEQNQAIRKATSTLENALETIKKQQDLLSFLYHGEMVDNPAVEFIGVKTYRNGWEYLMLHGETLDIPNGADVTIWADHGEAIRVDVDHN